MKEKDFQSNKKMNFLPRFKQLYEMKKFFSLNIIFEDFPMYNDY